MTVTMPYLKYLSTRDQAWPTEHIVGDTPLFNAHEVSVHVRPARYNGELRVVVTGLLRKKDGTRGLHSRGSVIDVHVGQPQWLSAIIEDAKVRLDA